MGWDWTSAVPSGLATFWPSTQRWNAGLFWPACAAEIRAAAGRLVPSGQQSSGLSMQNKESCRPLRGQRGDEPIESFGIPSPSRSELPPVVLPGDDAAAIQFAGSFPLCDTESRCKALPAPLAFVGQGYWLP